MKIYCFLTWILCLIGIKTTYAQYPAPVLFEFNGTDGGNPYGALIRSGNILYGTGTINGAYNNGNIYSIHSDGNGYKDLFDFNQTTGYGSYWPLTLSGSKLYGTTSWGGTNDSGVIFSIDTNGNNFKILHNVGNNALTFSGNRLYGMTLWGGTNNNGYIFSMDTSGNNFKDLFDFNGTNGEEPEEGLLISGNKMYGTTTDGGLYNDGVIFSIDTNGTRFKVLMNFNDTNGRLSVGNLTIVGSTLYGTTYYGGIYDNGCIFSIDTNGNRYKKLLNFNGSAGVTGQNPRGALLFSRGILYGAASDNIFAIDTSGSKYWQLFQFDVTDGLYPNGLTTSNNGDTLYGATILGGTYSDGVIFAIDTSAVVGINRLTNNLVNLRVFPNPNNGLFTIRLANNIQPMANSRIEIYNMLGEKVYSVFTHFSSLISINLGFQPNGVYLYRVIDFENNTVASGKFIIQ